MIPDTKEAAPSTLWIDRRKVRKTLSPTNFNEVTIFQAHSHESPGLIPYVGKNYHDKVVEKHNLEIERLKGANLSEKGL